MSDLLHQALTKVQELPDAEQDAIAALKLDELADEQRWQEAFARSQSQLSQLAEKAREDIRRGRVRSAELVNLRIHRLLRTSW